MGLRENNVPALLLNFQRLGLSHAFITHLLPGVPVTGEGICWHTQQGHFLFFSWCLWAEIGQREEPKGGKPALWAGGWLGTREGGKAQGQNLFLPDSLVQGALWA